MDTLVPEQMPERARRALEQVLTFRSTSAIEVYETLREALAGDPGDAKPTLGAECRFTAAFQTQFRGTLNALMFGENAHGRVRWRLILHHGRDVLTQD